MRTNRAVLPALIARGGGAIVNIASVAAFNASPGMATYAASKSGIVSFTRSIAATYGPQGVRANCLCPGWTQTPMSEAEMARAAQAAGTTPEAEHDKLAGQLALRRMASPEEIANCALFLASDMASFVTGAVLVADGGGRVPASIGRCEQKSVGIASSGQARVNAESHRLVTFAVGDLGLESPDADICSSSRRQAVQTTMRVPGTRVSHNSRCYEKGAGLWVWQGCSGRRQPGAPRGVVRR